ncbi:MAG: cation-transporting P-type ATPase [Ferruginibacter sp.]
MPQIATLENFWSLNRDNALHILSTTDKGLSNETAEDRLKQYGANTFKARSKSSSVILYFITVQKSDNNLINCRSFVVNVFGRFS